MKRREFITLVGGAVVWPFTAHAQQSAMPVIGYLTTGTLESDAPFLVAFREGLRATGRTEGKNVSIEYRWGEFETDRLPALADDVRFGLIASLNRPGGNMTGVAALQAELVAKRVEQLRVLRCRTSTIILHPGSKV
jgi:hypothetical protein